MRTLPRRAFVVEDEYFVLLDIKDALTRMGCVVVHAVGSLREAMEWAAKVEADFAVVDVNVKGEKVYPAAEILKERGLPFVFCTGYDQEYLDPQWADYPSIQKPFSVEELAIAIEKWLASLN
ncbi:MULTISPECIES: response regulator [Mesorhizobium]|uniref:Response regulator n=1 Tax=Mesorhizobium denitrificans TaxID=2294114 RepID=A0A371X404_9HYPH|nr:MULTISPECIES: response regulator [Mesorhizobium]RFC63957.1 response regulator [Mesorhizobium denitrificans]